MTTMVKAPSLAEAQAALAAAEAIIPTLNARVDAERERVAVEGPTTAARGRRLKAQAALAQAIEDVEVARVLVRRAQAAEQAERVAREDILRAEHRESEAAARRRAVLSRLLDAVASAVDFDKFGDLEIRESPTWRQFVAAADDLIASTTWPRRSGR